MEEELKRFEQEIAFPADDNQPPGEAKTKPLPPPPGPPELIMKADEKMNKKDKILKEVLPEESEKAGVLTKPPPPPPPTTNVQPQPTPLSAAPPPPPTSAGPLLAPGTQEMSRIQGSQMSQQAMQGPPVSSHIQFIPHQVQRHPPRPPMPPPRPTLMQVRSLPGSFPGPPGPLPFPLGGPLLPPMPHHMPLPPMGMPLPMGPGFCPPPPPGMAMGPIPMGHMNMPPQPFVPTSTVMNYQPRVQPSKKDDSPVKTSTKSEPEVASAPAVYAAPPTKSLSDKIAEFSVAINGQISISTTVNSSMSQSIDEPKSGKTAEESSTAATTPTPTVTEPVATKKEKKKKKLIRMAGGQTWEDNSLTDWDPDDFRIFCGDLGNDVTDEVLIRAFSKYSSFVKAKVIRDKRTNKTKGYGFVSFKDPQDFIKAMREMNGRYVGSRPIKLRKSVWKDRNIELVRKKQKEKEKLGLL